MSTSSLILIGGGGHAHACIDVIEQHGLYRIAGLVGMPQEVHTQILGYSVIASDEGLKGLAQTYPFALIAVGHIRSAERRKGLYHRATEFGFQFPSIIAPTAHVSSHACIGNGTIIMHGAIVNAGARVGNNCIINTRALVDHDVTVENHCHISTGAILNGDVTIGSESFVGSGSIVKEGVSIGKGCLVGMGLSVRHSLADHIHFAGNEKL
nr:NeuD/PglB/VioB family sugar acetyltransferase [uncultured Desulfobulbus sp.]